jgi:hypothetical protein
MAIVLQLTTENVTYQSQVNTDATVAVMPNFPGSGSYPNDTYANTVAALINRKVETTDIPDVTVFEQRVSTNTTNITTLQGQYTQLEDRVQTIEANPFTSVTFDAGTSALVFTLANGDTITSNAIPFVDQVAQDAAAAAQTTANGKASIVTLTQAEYDALAVKDANTLYVISG